MSAFNCKPRPPKTLAELLGLERAPLPGCGKPGLCDPSGHGSREWCRACSKTSDV